MNPLSKTLDYLGLVLLAVAAVVLGGSMWFLDEVVSGVLLRTFAPCLGAAVSLLLLGRVIELGYYVASDPQRDYRRADGSAARRSATVVAANWGRASGAEQAEFQPAVLDDAA